MSLPANSRCANPNQWSFYWWSQKQINDKLPDVRDWRSTLHNWRFCQIQSHVTQKLGRISKIRPDQIYILCPGLRIRVSCQLNWSWTCLICSDFVKRTKFHEKLVRHCCWCGRGLRGPCCMQRSICLQLNASKSELFWRAAARRQHRLYHGAHSGLGVTVSPVWWRCATSASSLMLTSICGHTTYSGLLLAASRPIRQLRSIQRSVSSSVYQTLSDPRRLNTLACRGHLPLLQLLLDEGQFIQICRRGCCRKASFAVSDDNSISEHQH